MQPGNPHPVKPENFTFVTPECFPVPLLNQHSPMFIFMISKISLGTSLGVQRLRLNHPVQRGMG